jgi:hypothetical protein
MSGSDMTFHPFLSTLGHGQGLRHSMKSSSGSPMSSDSYLHSRSGLQVLPLEQCALYLETVSLPT